MENTQRLTNKEADAIEKTLLSKANIGPPGAGIMGAHMVATYATTDGRTLVNEFGNGWGEWYVKTPNTGSLITPPQPPP